MRMISVKLQMNNSRLFLFFNGFQCDAKNAPNSISSIHICPHSESTACLLDRTNIVLHSCLCPNSTLTKSMYFSEVCANTVSFTLQERLIKASLSKSYFPDICLAPFSFSRWLVQFSNLDCIILSSHYSLFLYDSWQ